MLPSPHPAVVCKPVSEGAVLLHTETEVYYGLNGVGLRVWESLPPACQDFTEVYDTLQRFYPEVDRAQLVRDVAEILEALSTEGLIVANA